MNVARPQVNPVQLVFRQGSSTLVPTEVKLLNDKQFEVVLKIPDNTITGAYVLLLSDESSCNYIKIDDFVLNVSTSVSSQTRLGDLIKLFPNPQKIANNKIHIQFGHNAPGNFEIKIFNTLGNELLKADFHKNQGVQLFHLNLSKQMHKGLYYVHIRDKTNNHLMVKKIVMN